MHIYHQREGSTGEGRDNIGANHKDQRQCRTENDLGYIKDVNAKICVGAINRIDVQGSTQAANPD